MWWQIILAWSAFVTGTLAGIEWGRRIRGTNEAEKLDYHYLEGVYAGEKFVRDDIRVIVTTGNEEQTAMLEMPTIEEANELLPGVNYFSEGK